MLIKTQEKNFLQHILEQNSEAYFIRLKCIIINKQNILEKKKSPLVSECILELIKDHTFQFLSVLMKERFSAKFDWH